MLEAMGPADRMGQANWKHRSRSSRRCLLTRIVAHVGNSRAYLVRAGTLYRVTTDHTVAQLLAEAGIINRKMWRVMPGATLGEKRSESARAISTPDVQRLRLESGDRVLLCTDGLTRNVER